MDERASFEPQAVLEPRRARRTRLALLMPALALVAIGWAGFSGARPDQAIGNAPDPTAGHAPGSALPGSGAQAAPPELEVLGGDATPVVVLGRLDDSGAECSIPARCGRALVVDHVAWTPGRA